MYDVVVLSLGDGTECAAPRTPVLSCVDALSAAGARVETVTAHSDEEVDAVLARLDSLGDSLGDGLDRRGDGKTRLIVAAATDGQLRAVVRRLVRRYAPAPSRRPAHLRADRTVPDLPPFGVLPLGVLSSGVLPVGGLPVGGLPVGRFRAAPGGTDLAARLGLVRDPAGVAAAVLAGRVRRLDLLRTDAGSVTLDGTLLGGADGTGRAVPWRGRVEVDDAVLTDGGDPVLACVVANASGYATVDGLPLVTDADPADGMVDVAVAVPVLARSWWRGTSVRVEVRRSRGRAVSVAPRDGAVPLLDDGVSGLLSRKRSWWVEPGAWAVYHCDPA